MGGGKGGGVDTSGMEAAARESNALQERIYNESVERGMPFYKGGKAGFDMLMDYMGVPGGASMQTRGQIREELLPEYTTSITNNAGTDPVYYNNSGGIISADKLIDDPGGSDKKMYYANGMNHFAKMLTPGATQTDQVDYDGLNAAIDARLAGQEGSEPDYYGSLLKPFSMDDYQADPGYQFRLDEGQKALERRLAAQGKTFSPEAAKALMGYNQGMASQEYGNAYNRYNMDQGNTFNRLASIAGIGQTQTGQMAGLGQNYANAVGQTNSSLANAQAAAAQADAANKGSMFNSLLGMGANLGSSYMMATALSDRDLKENIKYLRQEKGQNIYEFNYKGRKERFEGVMAQEVMESRPDCVVMRDGHYTVDYGRLGLQMKEIG